MATMPKTKTAAPVARKAPARRPARKAAAKAVATKPAVKPVVRKAPVQTVRKSQVVAKASALTRTAPPAKAKNDPVPKKVKLVRDSFSFPEHEHALLGDMKKRALKLGKEFKKSEILRAGIAHLASLADSALVTVLAKVERVKTGRPAKKSKKK